MKLKTLLLLATVSSLQAATVTWGTPTALTGALSEIIDSPSFTTTLIDSFANSGTFIGGTGPNNLTASGSHPDGITGPAYETALNTLSFGGGFSNVTLTGLIPGQNYRTQFFFIDVSESPTSEARVTTLDGTGPTLAGTGEAVIGSFTADATGTQVVALETLNSVGGSATVERLSLVALTQVNIPEPSSSALVGLAGLSLIARRKRS